MNKAAIKTFAVWARKKLISDIEAKAGLVGITGQGIARPLASSTAQIQYFNIGTETPYTLTGNAIRSREKLAAALEREAEESDYGTAYENLLENTASAWFNRLIALRFMEVNDYFSDHLRVLSSTEPGKQDPDLVSQPFESDLEFSDRERKQIFEWKIQNESDALFQFLFIKKCNELHRILPGIFEDKEDDTEFLMSLSFIEKDGLVYRLVHDIPEEDWRDQVQIIGWIYQYYNSELKDETFSLLKKNVKITKERIPSATQLFTPDWIVRYMVENSLGRLWLEGHPNETLRKEWRYYLDEAGQEPEVEEQLRELRKEYKTLSPEDIRFIDPCMGSGHILVYAFDVLMQIYESCGYTAGDAAQSILEHNLYGLDIDERAYQLAYFAVMMKARQYSRRILRGAARPHVYSVQESNLMNRGQLKYFGAGLSEEEREEALRQTEELLDVFRDAKEYGSILNVEECDWGLLRRFVAETGEDAQLSMDSVGLDETKERLEKLVEIGEVMAGKYHVTCTNPPYMGISNGDGKLNQYVKKNYPDSKADLFAVFIERCGQMTRKNGFQAMITQHAWMFLSSFEKLREKLQTVDIVNMAHLGARAFEEIGGEVVQTTSFVLRNGHHITYKGEYLRLVAPTTQNGKKELFLSNRECYIAQQDNFFVIPGRPVAYWASYKTIHAFKKGSLLKENVIASVGIQTGNNEKFVYYWWEIVIGSIYFNAVNKEDSYQPKRWFPYNKGGEYRKWYGNNNFVINWRNDGEDIKRNSQISGAHYQQYDDKIKFKPMITWSRISSGLPAFRMKEKGFLSDMAGFSLYANSNKLNYICAFCNSKVAEHYLQFLAPTLNFMVGSVTAMPYISNNKYSDCIDKITLQNLSNSKTDWDSFETSWDFACHPLATLQMTSANNYDDSKPTCPLSSVYKAWELECENRFTQLKSNEEELNRIFIDIYGLQDELTPEVEDKDVTVRKADLQRDIRSLLSYAVGCMFGRYSLDEEGLIYAGGKWADVSPYERDGTLREGSRYRTFPPDADNCIPILDNDYLPDDIVGRFVEFVRVVYGEETLEENLDFIANALGSRGTTSREIIRNYFLRDFYKDHLKIYQKRPIYWLFDSGKQDGFKALIYMHRYDEDTIGLVRADYLHKIQEKYENEVRAIDAMSEHISDPRQKAAGEKRKEKLFKQIKETKEYDEKISHLALERISIDLDDGVKVNYAKVQTDRNGDMYQILAPLK